jgi:flagella basal body P-ring formation protein FlgA
MPRSIRSLISALAVLTLTLALGAPGAMAEVTAHFPVTLKVSPSVSGDKITLGDLFDNAGAAASQVVIAAPAPGHTLQINAASLAQFAVAHGLAWSVPNGTTTVDVTRAGRKIGTQAITDALAKLLTAKSGGRDLEVHLLQGNLTLTGPLDAPAMPQVKLTSYDPSNGRFEADVAVVGGQSAHVIGTSDEVMRVPVLAHPVQRGDIIANGDLEWIPVRIKALSRQMVTNADNLVGQAARRPLRSGQPILASDVQRPIAVHKGVLVTMTFEVPGMRLTTVGRALENGAIGDSINVLNVHSHRTVTGIVVSENTVKLAPSMPRVLGQQASLAQ